VPQTDFGIALLKLFYDLMRQLAAAGDLAEVFGHLVERIWRAVG
jgi:hypothetical protein